PLLAHLGNARVLVLFGEIRIVADLVDLWFRVSAQYYVGASARPVSGDGPHLGAPSLGNNLCFAGVLFGVQHLVWKFLLLKQFCQEFRVLDRSRTDQYRLT